MCGQTHVIYVGCRLAIFRHGDRTVPETEVVHSVRALGHSEEGFAVRTLDTHDEDIFSVPLYSSRIECGVHFETLHQIWVGLLVKVITPEKRGVCTGQNRIDVAFIDTVSFYGLVLSCDEGFVLGLQPLQSLFKIHDLFCLDPRSGRG